MLTTMPRAPAILIIDSNPSDGDLSALLLNRAYPEAEVRIVNDAVSFADALTSTQHDVAIVAPKLTWGPSEHVVRDLKHRCPGVAVILFGHESDIVQQSMSPSLVFEGIARKSSAGFMALADVVIEVLERKYEGSSTATAALSVEDLPWPAIITDENTYIRQVNSVMESFLGDEGERWMTSKLEDLLGDDEAIARWRDFCTNPQSDLKSIDLDIEGVNGQSGVISVRRRANAYAGSRFLACIYNQDATAGEGTIHHPSTAELLNHELRDIALVFSHDLKEPIQQIMRLSRHIADQQQFSPGNPAHKWMTQILQCSQRTSNMLDSMLGYLAVSSRDSSHSLVDLNQIMEHALDNLRTAIDDTGAEITSDHLPPVAGDEYQMLHLFQNLISNALKFRGRDRPVVRIKVEQRGQEWQLAFADNGIGIADPYLNRVFEMGQRLHTQEEYPGTGLGLSICRRIVERHGGQIWAKSNDGDGCTFFILFPKTPSHITRLA